MDHHFAVVDDEHDVKDPVTVVRVSERTGVTEFHDEADWVEKKSARTAASQVVPAERLTPGGRHRIERARLGARRQDQVGPGSPGGHRVEPGGVLARPPDDAVREGVVRVGGRSRQDSGLAPTQIRRSTTPRSRSAVTYP
ncbi:hypothetical protein I0C86_15105 [Plantactinospora sp. S1510]|uniref:Uncharacterized protein n=1 Tax=Plantactinospora alkalitolerans TaxID=2789879 RepID=A0ABS0GW20_9ACTN|nr:hypothetical protein [Plantactinospora alkalitolerans]MBF9130274.1 hypothetical protein [Plantactinospora alkalitolerans]